jgi:tyrosyl-tRNA synthetase
LVYENYSQIERDFTAKKLHPLDLKNAVADEIYELLKPIQKERKSLEKLEKKAYD